jgi:hypothetical protein
LVYKKLKNSLLLSAYHFLQNLVNFWPQIAVFSPLTYLNSNCATLCNLCLHSLVEDIFSLKSTATLCFAILKPVHVKMLHQLEENFRAFDFKIIYRKGNEMSSDFSSRQVVNLIQIDNRQMEKDQN